MSKTSASDVFLRVVRKYQPDARLSIFDSERISAVIPFAEMPAFEAFVEKWCLDYPGTRRIGTVLEAYARHKAKSAATQGSSRFVVHHKGLDLLSKLESEYHQECSNWQRGQSGDRSKALDSRAGGCPDPATPARRPYCLPESFVGTVWAAPDARRDAVRMVEDQEGDELPDCFRPMGVRAQPVHATVNA